MGMVYFKTSGGRSLRLSSDTEPRRKKHLIQYRRCGAGENFTGGVRCADSYPRHGLQADFFVPRGVNGKHILYHD